MINNNYEEIEEFLSKLISLLEPICTQIEIKEIQDFIDVGEYGLALETAIYIIIEEKKQISKNIFELINKLANKMSIDYDILKQLTERIE